MLWTKEQTCVGPRLCNAFYQCEKERLQLPREGDKVIESEELSDWVKRWCGPTGQTDAFYICHDCKKLRRDQLVQCPSCNKYFKGPRPYFPVDFECPECE